MKHFSIYIFLCTVYFCFGMKTKIEKNTLTDKEYQEELEEINALASCIPILKEDNPVMAEQLKIIIEKRIAQLQEVSALSPHQTHNTVSNNEATTLAQYLNRRSSDKQKIL